MKKKRNVKIIITPKKKLDEIKRNINIFVDGIEGRHDVFEISYGNLKVLESIPKMMTIPKWREQLRRLIMDFTTEEVLYSDNKRRAIKWW